MNGNNGTTEKPWLTEIATLVEAKIGAALSTINATATALRADMDKLRKEIAQRDAQAAQREAQAAREATQRETHAAQEAGRRETRIIMSIVVTVGVAATVLGFVLKGGDAPTPIVVNNIPPSVQAPAAPRVQTPPVAAGDGR